MHLIDLLGSALLPKKKGFLIHTIQGFQVIDLKFRTIVVDLNKNGIISLPKKAHLYQKREMCLQEAGNNLKSGILSVDDYLMECAKAMIHENFYKMIKEATMIFKSVSIDTNVDIEED